MAYRKIPKKFDFSAIAEDLKAKLLYSEHFQTSTIDEIARIMGVSKRTVYAYLDGQIHLSLDFLHAAVIASDGDPDIRKYLEPEGFELKKTARIQADKSTLAEECLDDLPALSIFHRTLRSPGTRLVDIKRAKEAVIRELEENEMKWLEEGARANDG